VGCFVAGGNVVERSSEAFVLRLQHWSQAGEAKEAQVVLNAGAQQYEGSVQATRAGLNTLSVTYGDTALPGFPVTIDVVPADPDSTASALQPFPPTMIAGSDLSIQVHARDSFGNLVRQRSISAFALTLL
jgi:hypothetical protein